MTHTRLRPEWPQYTLQYRVQLPDPVPQCLFDTARAMQALWNALVAMHDTMLASWTADTPRETKVALYEWYWSVAYVVVRDEGARHGLGPWQKWHVFDTMKSAVGAWAKGLRQKPKPHHGLERVVLPHRTASGGVPTDWLFTDHARKHTALLPPTPGHHWREAYMTIGAVRVPFRVLLHRDIPTDAVLKRLMLVGTFERAYAPAHRPWSWHLLLIIEVPPRPARPTAHRAMGLDLGWRVLDDGLRVAVCTDGQHLWELRIPWDMANSALRKRQRLCARHGLMQTQTGSWIELWDRQAQKDRRLEQCKQALASCETAHWPQTAQHARTQLARMRAGGLVRLRRMLADAGLTVACLEDWYETDRVLWRRLRGAQQHLLRARNALYREYADWLARHADVVAWEGDLDLKAMAEADLAPTDYVLQRARKYRQMAGIHHLRRFICEALAKAGRTRIDHPAAYTSQRCSVPACDGMIVPGPEVERMCENGHHEDQDISASMVLWQDIPSAQRPWPQYAPVPEVDRATLARGLRQIA